MLVAGDPERKSISEVEKDGGIHYHVNLLRSLVCEHFILFYAQNINMY